MLKKLKIKIGGQEYLDAIVSIKIVKNFNEAIESY